MTTIEVFRRHRVKVTREWRKLQNEELNGLYSTLNIVWVINIRKNVMGGACSTYVGKEACIQGLMGKPEGKRPLVRPRHRWEDNEMDLHETG